MPINYYPILIPTLNRDTHFKRCVESLSKCVGAKQTVLYIALDYPLNSSHEVGYKKIKDYIPLIKGFKEIVVIQRDYNWGAEQNIADAKKTVFRQYDCLIFTEDDNEFSSNFLTYMNEGLERFKRDRSVFTISGYNYILDIPKNNYTFYTTPVVSAWGMGLWKEKENNFEQYVKKQHYKRLFTNPILLWKVLFFCPGVYSMLKHMIEGESFFGDTCRVLYSLQTRKRNIFPMISMVRNWGDDGSGLHSGGDNMLHFQQIDKKDYFEWKLAPIKVSRIIRKQIQIHFTEYEGQIEFLKKLCRRTLLKLILYGQSR